MLADQESNDKLDGAPRHSVRRLVRRVHVIPIGDTGGPGNDGLHAAQEICWCHPTETEPRLWVHNAHDCREARERVTGEQCSDGWINIAEFVELNNAYTQKSV